MDYSNNMKRYRDNISERFASFVTQVSQEAKNNCHDIKVLAEDFYAEYLNVLYGWELKNANITCSNEPGIDLCYDAGNIIVQVSSDDSREKIQKSLDKTQKSSHPSGRFCFVAIKDTAKKYKVEDFTPPSGITFNPVNDIFDNARLIREASRDGIDKLKDLSELMDKYFSSGEKKHKGQYLTEPPAKADKTNVICREDELSKIEAMLKRGENILLMSGFGGIGKTALARLVFHTVRENYDQVAWIPYRKNLKESLLGTIKELNGNDPEERWLEIQRILNNGASKLIVIDNADQDDSANQLPHKDDDLISLTGRPDVTIIVTSRRNKLPSFTTYPVGFMDEDKCVALFYCYYENPQRAEDEPVVRKLIKMAGCHTFTVELLAKGANCEDSLEEYYQDLKNEGFSFPEIEVDTAHNDATTTIAGHLKILFNRKTRTDIQMELLYDFSVLPAAATLNKREIKAWFGIDVNPCEQLVKDGWLLREGGRYAMHPLVKEILHLDPIPENTAEKFLAFIADTDNGYCPDNEVYTERDRKLALAESVVAAVCRKNTLQFAHILDNIGGAYWQAGQYPKAEEYFIRAITIKEAKLRKEDPDTATTYNNIASVFYAKGDLEKALEFYEKSLRVKEVELGKDHPSTATTYNNIALVYQGMGNLEKALEFFEKDMAISEAKLGKDHPDTATTYNNIASVYQAKGDLEKALKFFEKDMAISEVKLGKDHPDTATTYNNIALVYKEMGNFDKALNFFKKALAIYEVKLGKNHPNTATIYNNIALVYDTQGNLDKALEFYEKAKDIREAKLGDNHPNTATTYHNIGTLYYAKKDYTTAKGYFLRALRIYLRKLGSGNSYVDITMGWLSACCKVEKSEPEAFFTWLMEQLDEELRKILSAHLQEDRE